MRSSRSGWFDGSVWLGAQILEVISKVFYWVLVTLCIALLGGFVAGSLLFFFENIRTPHPFGMLAGFALTMFSAMGFFSFLKAIQPP